jgi:nitroreductase
MIFDQTAAWEVLPMEALECIRTRRSIRRFKPEHLAPGTIEQLIELAAWAPSWANTQCVRYLAITGEQKANLAQIINHGNNQIAASQAPVIIAICAIHDLAGKLRSGQPNPKGNAWTYFDCGGAAQTLCLAAHAMGLASLQMGAFDYAAVSQLLNVPDTMELIELVAIGIADGTPTAPARKPVPELLRYEKF